MAQRGAGKGVKMTKKRAVVKKKKRCQYSIVSQTYNCIILEKGLEKRPFYKAWKEDKRLDYQDNGLYFDASMFEYQE